MVNFRLVDYGTLYMYSTSVCYFPDRFPALLSERLQRFGNRPSPLILEPLHDPSQSLPVPRISEITAVQLYRKGSIDHGRRCTRVLQGDAANIQNKRSNFALCLSIR